MRKLLGIEPAPKRALRTAAGMIQYAARRDDPMTDEGWDALLASVRNKPILKLAPPQSTPALS